MLVISFGPSIFYQSAVFASGLRNVYLSVLLASLPSIAVQFAKKPTGIITGICAEKSETIKNRQMIHVVVMTNISEPLDYVMSGDVAGFHDLWIF